MYGGNQLEEQITNIRREKDCDFGSVIDSVIENYGNISMEALFIEEITDESLKTAARHYFRIRFCDFNTEVVQFYENLFKHFPLESVLKTLARILLVANEKKLRKGFNNNFLVLSFEFFSEHYQVAKALFDKTTSEMDLVLYRDIATLTTTATEIELYQDLKDHQVDVQSVSSSKLKIEELEIIKF